MVSWSACVTFSLQVEIHCPTESSGMGKYWRFMAPFKGAQVMHAPSVGSREILVALRHAWNLLNSSTTPVSDDFLKGRYAARMLHDTLTA
jgi:hypothetical protein